MSLTGGKRKVNKSLKAWVTFVKKVQREEKLSYKDAIHRAKIRKDKGEKWMTGGATPTAGMTTTPGMTATAGMTTTPDTVVEEAVEPMEEDIEVMTGTMGGKRRRRTMRRSRGRGRGSSARRARGRTARRARGRASRRH